MWGRFTETARRVVFHAQEEAQRRGQKSVGPAHLLLGLLREPNSSASRALAKLGVAMAELRVNAESQIVEGEAPEAVDDFAITDAAKGAINRSYSSSRKLNLPYIDTVNLLIGLIGDKTGTGPSLAHFGVTIRAVEKAFKEIQHEPWAETRKPTTPPRRRMPLQGSVPFALFLEHLGAAPDGVAARAIQQLGINGDALFHRPIPAYLQELGPEGTFDELCEEAQRLATGRGREADTGDFLVAAVTLPVDPFAKVLTDIGVTRERLEAAINRDK